jgi:hypothetical protein
MLMMSPEEFTRRMSVLESTYKRDPEAFLVHATDLMAIVLRQEGFSAGVSIFERNATGA